jgi:hypothetical protein
MLSGVLKGAINKNNVCGVVEQSKAYLSLNNIVNIIG